MNKYQQNYNKQKSFELPKLTKMQGGLVSFCYDFLSDIPDEEKKYKLKKIIMMSIKLSKDDSEIKQIMKESLISIYGITSKDNIENLIDNRITIHIEAFDSMVHRLLQHYIDTGTDGYSGSYDDR